jgi:hypothetical protein
VQGVQGVQERRANGWSPVPLDSPPARRVGRPRWLDPRLVAGVALVLAATLLGARLVSAAGHTTLVWAAATNLAPGEPLSAAELTPVRVNLGGEATRYLDAARPVPSGYQLTRAVAAGELLPFSALTRTAAAAPTRVVALGVAVGHFDPGLAAGDLVDVYETPRSADGAAPAGASRLVLADATVSGRTSGSSGFGSVTSDVTVLVIVPVTDVPALVAAAEAGGLDLVDVPPGGGP